MIIKELYTEPIEIFKPNEIYATLDNLLFIKNGHYTSVFDIEKNEYILQNIKGVIMPITILENEKEKIYFRIIENISLKEYSYRTVQYNSYVTKKLYCYDTEKEKCYRCKFVTQDNELIEKCFIQATTDITHLFELENYKDKINSDNCYQIKHIPYKYADIINIDTNSTTLNEFFKNAQDQHYTFLKTRNRDKDQEIDWDFERKERTEKFDWEARSKFNNELAIVYKNGQYAVINSINEKVFNYNEDIIYIKILTPELLILKNKHQQQAIYKINHGYIINFDDNIKFEDAYVFKNTNKIILINDKNIKIIDDSGNQLLDANIESMQLSTINQLFYKENNNYYMYDLETNNKKLININKVFILENGETTTNIGNNKYFYKLDNGQIILTENLKYGICIEENDICSTPLWFNSKKDMYKFEKELLNSLLELPNLQTLPKEKKLSKKIQ